MQRLLLAAEEACVGFQLAAQSSVYLLILSHLALSHKFLEEAFQFDNYQLLLFDCVLVQASLRTFLRDSLQLGPLLEVCLLQVVKFGLEFL